MADQTSSKEPVTQMPYHDDEIDLQEVARKLWDGKWIISSVTGAASIISVVIALSLPNIYTATTLVAPAQGSGGSVSGLMSQYGGLASLAGISLPVGEDGSRAQLGIQLLKSRAFLGQFVERRELLPELLAFESWDHSSARVRFNPNIYDASTQKWVREAPPNKSTVPSLQEAHRAFVTILSISQDKNTGYVSLSIEHEAPEIAARWANWLIEDVNNVVRAQDVAEAEKSIEYLKQQVANTSLLDLQKIFFELIQSQTETVMLAEVRPEYVFKTIDPAVVPDEPSKPNRALISLLGAMVGFLLGSAIALFGISRGSGEQGN